MDTALILVVEDEATISNFICRALASAGYRTLTAHTGREALTLFFSHRPELVLLDLGLPDMDGLEVLEQLRSDPGQEIPVIILTARDSEVDIQISCPEKVVPFSRQIETAVSQILARNDLTPSRVAVRRLERPVTLTEVFPKIFEGKNSVNVKV